MRLPGPKKNLFKEGGAKAVYKAKVEIMVGSKNARRKKIVGNRNEAKNAKKKAVFHEEGVITPTGMIDELKHATDRPSFWAGVALLILAGVMFVHGATNTSYMAAGLGGALALVIE